jgi:predicted GIY-YIG superfamily endonuclease
VTEALYRMRSADGTLLYVGITACLPARIKQHAGGKRWWDEVATITVEHFPTRDEVEVAELEAIRSERPTYNVKDNPNVQRPRRPPPKERSPQERFRRRCVERFWSGEPPVGADATLLREDLYDMLLGADRREPLDWMAVANLKEVERDAAVEADRQFFRSEEGRRIKAAKRAADLEIKSVGSGAWGISRLAISHGVQAGEDRPLGQLVGYYAACLVIEWLASWWTSVPDHKCLTAGCSGWPSAGSRPAHAA